MFKLNEELKTNSGQHLTPFLVDGNTVYCFDRSKRTIQKKLSDFNFTIGPKTKAENVISVSPISTKIIAPKPLEKQIEKSIVETIEIKPVKLPDIVQPNIETIIETELEKVVVERTTRDVNKMEELEIQYSTPASERSDESTKKASTYGAVTGININDDDYI